MTKLSHWLVTVLVQNSYNLVRDPLGRAPLPHMELILFVARAKKRRPELAKRLRTRRALITEIVVITNRAAILAAPPPWGTHKGATATVRWKRKPSPDSLQWSTPPEQLQTILRKL